MSIRISRLKGLAGEIAMAALAFCLTSSPVYARNLSYDNKSYAQVLRPEDRQNSTIEKIIGQYASPDEPVYLRWKYNTIGHRFIDINNGIENYLYAYRFLDTIISEAEYQLGRTRAYQEFLAGKYIKSDEMSKTGVKYIFDIIDGLIRSGHSYLTETAYNRSFFKNKNLGDDGYILLKKTKNGLYHMFLPNKHLIEVRESDYKEPAIGNFGIDFISNTLFAAGLEKKMMDCDNLSILYKSIGQALSMPISITFLPNHAYVSWNFPDNKVFNYETTTGTVNMAEPQENNEADMQKPDRVYEVSEKEDVLEAVAYFNRAIEWYNRDDYSMSLADFCKSALIDPKFSKSFFGIGFILDYQSGKAVNKEKGDEIKRKALLFFDKALSLDPDNTYMLFNRGRTYMGLNNCVKAFVDFDRLIKLGCDDPEFINLLKESVNRCSRTDAALESFLDK